MRAMRLGVLLVCLAWSAAGATSMRFTMENPYGEAISNRLVTLTPWGVWPATNHGVLVIGDTRTFRLTNTVTVSMVPGTYRGDVSGTNGVRFYFNVPDLGGTVDVWTNLIHPTSLPTPVYSLSGAQSDLRYFSEASGDGVTVGTNAAGRKVLTIEGGGTGGVSSSTVTSIVNAATARFAVATNPTIRWKGVGNGVTVTMEPYDGATGDWIGFRLWTGDQDLVFDIDGTHTTDLYADAVYTPYLYDNDNNMGDDDSFLGVQNGALKWRNFPTEREVLGVTNLTARQSAALTNVSMGGAAPKYLGTNLATITDIDALRAASSNFTWAVSNALYGSGGSFTLSASNALVTAASNYTWAVSNTVGLTVARSNVLVNLASNYTWAVSNTLYSSSGGAWVANTNGYATNLTVRGKSVFEAVGGATNGAVLKAFNDLILAFTNSAVQFWDINGMHYRPTYRDGSTVYNFEFKEEATNHVNSVAATVSNAIAGRSILNPYGVGQYPYTDADTNVVWNDDSQFLTVDENFKTPASGTSITGMILAGAGGAATPSYYQTATYNYGDRMGWIRFSLYNTNTGTPERAYGYWGNGTTMPSCYWRTNSYFIADFVIESDWSSPLTNLAMQVGMGGSSIASTGSDSVYADGIYFRLFPDVSTNWWVVCKHNSTSNAVDTGFAPVTNVLQQIAIIGSTNWTACWFNGTNVANFFVNSYTNDCLPVSRKIMPFAYAACTVTNLVATHYWRINFDRFKIRE